VPRSTEHRVRYTAALALGAALTACATVPPPSLPEGGPAAGAAGAGGTATAEPRFRAEIEQLAANPRVRDALSRIDAMEERTVEDQIALTEIPAPPFAEEARARAFLQMMRGAGADTVFLDEEGNAIGIRRGSGGGGALVLSGHLDTVFPEGTDVKVRVRGDTLFAPGISDDGRGLTVVLSVLRAMAGTDLRTERDVWFVGTVGEEGLGDLRGVKHLFREGGPRIGAFISVDGAGDDRVVNQALGSRRYRAVVHGPGGHSWGAFGLANPAHALGRAIAAFDRAAAAYVAEGPRISYNVGVIGGGTSVNSIPFEAWMEVDMRSEDAGRLMGIDSLFRTAVTAAVEEASRERQRGQPLRAELNLVGDRPSGEIPPETPFVQRAMAAIEHTGHRPELQRSSTDSNVPISLGIPAVTLGGGGRSSGAHSLDEWWVRTGAQPAVRRTLLLVLAEAGLAR
jgi:tripeptide aminopeptidase